jgi:hypothetical protein
VESEKHGFVRVTSPTTKVVCAFSLIPCKVKTLIRFCDVGACMSWFQKVENDEMMWGVETDEALEALRELDEAGSYEKCVIAEGNGHNVVFFEGVEDGTPTLMEVSMTPDNSEMRNPPEKTMGGRVGNVYRFKDDWNDVYISDTLPEGLD